NKNNFHAAQEFFGRALQLKQRFGHDAATAASLRELGRVHLDWGNLEKAGECFQKGLQMSQKAADERGQASAFHYLGRVALAQGEREAAAGHKAAARKGWARAAEWLDASIRAHQARQRGILEAYARRDRALLCLAEGDLDRAEAH